MAEYLSFSGFSMEEEEGCSSPQESRELELLSSDPYPGRV